MKKNNVILIGMPGAGKSTIGVVLAKALGYRFLDSDILIQETEGKLLSEIIKEKGPDGFNETENRINSSIQCEKTVIATGGSAIYGKEAMEHFREMGTVVYIKLSVDRIEKRIGDIEERGISIKDGQTLKDLYEERRPLYEKYAHVIVSTDGLSIRESVMRVKSSL